MPYNNKNNSILANELDSIISNLTTLRKRNTSVAVTGLEGQFDRIDNIAQEVGAPDLRALTHWMMLNIELDETNEDQIQDLLQSNSYLNWLTILTSLLIKHDQSLLPELYSSLVEPNWLVRPSIPVLKNFAKWIDATKVKVTSSEAQLDSTHPEEESKPAESTKAPETTEDKQAYVFEEVDKEILEKDYSKHRTDISDEFSTSAEKETVDEPLFTTEKTSIYCDDFQLGDSQLDDSQLKDNTQESINDDDTNLDEEILSVELGTENISEDTSSLEENTQNNLNDTLEPQSLLNNLDDTEKAIDVEQEVIEETIPEEKSIFSKVSTLIHDNQIETTSIDSLPLTDTTTESDSTTEMKPETINNTLVTETIDINEFDKKPEEALCEPSSPNALETIEPLEEITSTDSDVDSEFTTEVDDIVMSLITIGSLSKDIYEKSNAFISELERLKTLSAIFDYNEITSLAEWCQLNISLFDQHKSSDLEQFISTGESWSWLALLNASLLDSNDSSLLTSLGSELMRNEWPAPLEVSKLKNLFLFLKNPSGQTFHVSTETITEQEETLPKNLDVDTIIDSDTDIVVETESLQSTSIDSSNDETNTDTESAFNLSWDSDIHPELLAAYFEETPNLVKETSDLLVKVSNSETTKDEQKTASRLAHTIKGGSAVVGITDLADFAYQLEKILDYSINNELSKDTKSLLLDASSCLEHIFDAVQNGRKEPENFASIFTALIHTSDSLEEDANDQEIELTAPSLPDFITSSNNINSETDIEINEEKEEPTLVETKTNIEEEIQSQSFVESEINTDDKQNDISHEEAIIPEIIESSTVSESEEITSQESPEPTDNVIETNALDEDDEFSTEVEDIIMSLMTIGASSKDIYAESDTFIEELERFNMLSTLFAYDEIVAVSDWCKHNISLFEENKSNELELFITSGECWSWIELTSACLTDPEELSLLSSLSAELMRSEWPEPLEMEALQNLLLFLKDPAGQLNNDTIEAQIEQEDNQLEDNTIVSDEPTIESAFKLSWDSDVHPELLAAYFEETPDLVKEVSQLMVKVSNDKTTKDERHTASRLAHTIKGGSAVVGITDLADYAYQLEKILDYSVEHDLSCDTKSLLKEASSGLEDVFNAVQNEQIEPEIFAPIFSALIKASDALEEEPDDQEYELSAPSLPDFITNANNSNLDEELEEESAKNEIIESEISIDEDKEALLPLVVTEATDNEVEEIISDKESNEIAETIETEFIEALEKTVSQDINEPIDHLIETTNDLDVTGDNTSEKKYQSPLRPSFSDLIGSFNRSSSMQDDFDDNAIISDDNSENIKAEETTLELTEENSENLSGDVLIEEIEAETSAEVTTDFENTKITEKAEDSNLDSTLEKQTEDVIETEQETIKSSTTSLDNEIEETVSQETALPKAEITEEKSEEKPDEQDHELSVPSFILDPKSNLENESKQDKPEKELFLDETVSTSIEKAEEAVALEAVELSSEEVSSHKTIEEIEASVSAEITEEADLTLTLDSSSFEEVETKVIHDEAAEPTTIVNVATEIEKNNTEISTLSKLDDKTDISDFGAEIDDIVMCLATISDTPDNVFKHIDDYINELQRLELLAEISGYKEIAETSQWCQINFMSFSENQGDSIREFIASGDAWAWIETTNIALTEPEEISHLSALSAALTDENWLEPLPLETLQNLLLLLRATTQPAEENKTSKLESSDSTSLAEESISNEEALSNFDDNANSQSIISWDDDVHPELLSVYFQETPEQIADVAALLQKISKGQANKEDHKNAARIAHTIKGASGVLGITALVELTHKLEDILDYSVSNQLPDETADLLAESSDCLESLFEAIQNKEPAPDEFVPILAKLTRTAVSFNEANNEANNDALDEQTLEMPSLPDFITTEETANKAPAKSSKKSKKKLAKKALKAKSKVAAINTVNSETHIRVPMRVIDSLLNLAGELVTTSGQVSDRIGNTLITRKNMKSQDKRVHSMLSELSTTIYQQEKDQHSMLSSLKDSDFDALEMDTYNELHSVVGLLTESILDSEDLENTLGTQIVDLSDHLRTLNHLNKELSDVILSSRMVSVNTLVPRLERIVRETCRKTGKKAELIVTGSEINIDTDIVNGLVDPLLHLLRNAIDHGIESPDARTGKNKDGAGKISLSFKRQGNFIQMVLKDDGKGIDPEKIYEHAIEKGLISPDEEFSKKEAIKLILHAGFSTQDKVTDISGRGVGMDVVKSAIDLLKGTLEIDSELGEGTSFTLKIPLTLVTSATLLVEVSGHKVAIPSDTIEQLYYLSSDKVIQRDDRYYINHDNKDILIQPLSGLLNWPTTSIDYDLANTLILVKNSNKIHAIYIDEIINSREVVIKKLAPWIDGRNGVIGATHLADGSVAPVLNLPLLLDRSDKIEMGNSDTVINKDIIEATPSTETPLILVVDDSLSNRKALSLVIDQTEYDVVTAVDGLDALNIMNEQNISMVFTDLEMPRMNGLELTQSIRAWKDNKHVPVVMITSRTTEKHRQLAEKAGVNDYLTKPVITELLLESMEQWIGENATANA